MAEGLRIGVYICHCGVNIAGMVDVEAVRDYTLTLDQVAVARDYKFMCSEPGQARQSSMKASLLSPGANRALQKMSALSAMTLLFTPPSTVPMLKQLRRPSASAWPDASSAAWHQAARR